MKNLFVSVKLKTIIMVICCVVILTSLIVFFSVKQTYQPKPEYTIVIDAGHGGFDVKLGQ